MGNMAWVAILGMVATTVPMPSVAYHGERHPKPIDRCGGFAREQAVLCYVFENGAYVDPTAKNATPVNVDEALGDALPESYVWNHRVEAYLADPASLAPAPHGVLWEEDNNVAGLQVRPFVCAFSLWFPEEGEQWLGPFNVFQRSPDKEAL